MLFTVAGMPSFVRLKSMMRYLVRLPPPMWRVVILPWLLRPPEWRWSCSRDFSGLSPVSSSYAETEAKRLPADVGLYFLIAIFSLSSSDYASDSKNSMGLLSSFSVTIAFLRSGV